MYRFGTKEDTFTSYLDIMRYFVEINHYKYFPYFAKRDNKWRASVHGLFLGPAGKDPNIDSQYTFANYNKVLLYN